VLAIIGTLAAATALISLTGGMRDFGPTAISQVSEERRARMGRRTSFLGDARRPLIPPR
jgi:hypothetical protein